MRKYDFSRYFRASGAIFAGGFLGMLYGALLGLVFATLLLPILGTPYGLVFGAMGGAVGGYVAGLVGVSVGGRIGYVLGGLVAGVAIVMLFSPFIIWWILVLAGAVVIMIATILGVTVSREIEKETSRWFLIDWLRELIEKSAVNAYPIWQRCVLGISVSAVILLPVLLIGWKRLN